MKNPFIRGPLVVALLVLLGIPLTGAIDETEFACEEAYQHLEDCCPHQPRFHCGSTCESTDLKFDIADCLRRTSCDDLVASGVCDAPTAAVCK